MALVNVTLSGTQSLSDRVQAVVATLKLAVHRRAVYNRTVRELRALSERDMSDLGIHPAMITEVAREAAYGK
jgi:uncharacterized protein YjiS (DUF1127 family)